MSKVYPVGRHLCVTSFALIILTAGCNSLPAGFPLGMATIDGNWKVVFGGTSDTAYFCITITDGKVTSMLSACEIPRVITTSTAASFNASNVVFTWGSLNEAEEPPTTYTFALDGVIQGDGSIAGSATTTACLGENCETRDIPFLMTRP